MSIFKCKMCGGSLEIGENESVATCEYCGTQQTLPKLDDERKANLYDRANHFRRNNEFDKAMGIYEQILNEDKSDAEAYWSLVLCRYGIEYVEDPATHMRVPTVNRAQFTSVFDDDNYKSALAYAADTLQRSVYESEAKAINEIQKGILAISQKEEPFDVFICYKETDANGRRTPDSVLANDLYHQLTQEGFKVFFARITLEDKLGTAYEPYIFAALNSAKVMVVLGTKPEHFNAVWVKNEWSRYLALVKQSGGKKILIPAYKDMDPYDLPEEFSHLQAQDMSKLGFMQDLIRGIKKIAAADEPKTVKETVVVSGAGNTTVAAQLKRGNIALEDHDWEKAEGFFEEALNLSPECAEAYIGKMLVRDKKPGLASWVAMQRDLNADEMTRRLEACPPDTAHIDAKAKELAVADYLDGNEIRRLYQYDLHYNSALQDRKELKEEQEDNLASDRLLTRARQYAQGETKKQLDDALAEITATLDKRIADAEKADAAAVERIKASYAKHLAQADKEAEKLNADAQARREDDYQAAVAAMESAADIPAYEAAIAKLEAMHGFKDCSKRKERCRTAIKEIIYKDGDALFSDDKFEDAIAAFEELGDFKDSRKRIEDCKTGIKDRAYAAAKALFDERAYEKAIPAFEELDGYKDSRELAEKCQSELDRQKAEAERLAAQKKKKKIRITIIAAATVCLATAFLIVLTSVIIPNGKYNDAVDLFNAGKYDEAAAAFEALGDYKDSADQVEICKNTLTEKNYSDAMELYNSGKYKEAIPMFALLLGYKDSSAMIEECRYSDAVTMCDSGNFEEALAVFESLGDYKDSAEMILQAKYGIAAAMADSGDTARAALAFADLGAYSDAKERSLALWDDLVPWNDTVAAGWYHTVCIKEDGTVVAVGENSDGQCDVSGWTDIVAIAAGGRSTFGRKANGTIVARGWNDDGQCNISGSRDIVAISASGRLTVGLKMDGTVVGFGWNERGCRNFSDWRNIIAISTGGYHTVGLRIDGTVVATGDNQYGQCNISDWTDIVAVATGLFHTVGLKSDGTVVATTYTKYPENYDAESGLSDWTDIVAIAAGDDYTLGLKSDGTVVATKYIGDPDQYYGQCEVSEWTDIVAIYAGDRHAVGLRDDGTVVATEYTGVLKFYDGQCDVSDWTNVKVPK